MKHTTHEIEASIGICYEKVIVHCGYEDTEYLPIIYKVIFNGEDILGCLSGQVIDELEVYADEVLKTLFQEDNEKILEEVDAKT